MINTKLLEFKCFKSEYGNLTPIEQNKDIPFTIERIYYITKVPTDKSRGYHSHKNLEQILICINGSVKIKIATHIEEEIIELTSPDKGLYIGPMIWREMFDFSEGSVLLVIASRHYSEEDYIRDYEEYKEIARNYFTSG